MKKRFVSLALCFLMVLTVGVSTACGEKTDEENLIDLSQSDTVARTITIWGIKGEGTTDEAVAAIEEEMSRITEAKFNTAIDLNLFFEDEYYDALEERMEAIEEAKEAEEEAAAERKKAEREAKKKGETLPPVETEPEETEETKLDEYGLPETVYPKVEDDQLDIFLITSYDKLLEYNENEMLSKLDSELSGSSQLIKQYVHPTLIEAGKVGKDTVAILNQQLVGEATYMLVNRELLAKYYYHIDEIADVTSVRNASEFTNALPFILEVKQYEPEYQPFVGYSGPLNTNFYTIDGEKSIFGWMAAPNSVYGDSVRPRFMLYENVRYTNYLKTYMSLKNNGCIGSETFTPDDKFAVGIMTGTPVDVAPYEENYHVLTILPPQGTEETLYNSMFAISSYTKDLARSMSIITYLNTRSDLRNLFGYGIEGVHYTVEDGTIDVISDEYNMKLEHTGNCFIAYPPEGRAADYWDSAKVHNTELVLSPFFAGFKVTEDNISPQEYSWAKGYSKWFYDDLDEATNDQEVIDVIEEWAERCDDSTRAQKYMNAEPEVVDDEEPTKTLAYVYAEWLKENSK